MGRLENRYIGQGQRMARMSHNLPLDLLKLSAASVMVWGGNELSFDLDAVSTVSGAVAFAAAGTALVSACVSCVERRGDSIL